MKKGKFLITLLVLAMVNIFCVDLYASIVFDFEDNDLNGWEVPDWAIEQWDQIVTEVNISDKETYGKSAYSMELMCDFPGDSWASASVEYNREIDLSGYKEISCRIFVPRAARAEGFLQARIILVAGPWWWIEQKISTPLSLGKWTKLEAKLDLTEDNQMSYWKRKDKEGTILANIDQVKKVIIRIEYNASERHAGPQYKGSIYIDDIEFVK